MTGEEIIRKLKDADSVSEVISIAKESGKELTEEQAGIILKGIKNGGEISDEELEGAVGGCGGGPLARRKTCPLCGSGRLIVSTYDYEYPTVKTDYYDQNGYHATVYRCDRCGVFMTMSRDNSRIIKVQPWYSSAIVGYLIIE